MYIQNHGKYFRSSCEEFFFKTISQKKFGFLVGRWIHDVVGAAQEGIHSIKENKISRMFM
jgi:hypothetical protein